MCPSAVEAMLGLQALGKTVTDDHFVIPSDPKSNPNSYLLPPITSCQWYIHTVTSK